MRFVTASLLAFLAIVAVGCGNQNDDSTPVACLKGPGVYEKALTAAPEEVLLDDEAPISDCLTRNQKAGELTKVGEAMVETATVLVQQERSEPFQGVAVRIGYLVGAARRGAEDTEGIHTDLLRRLTAAARYTPGYQPHSPEFEAEYREGFDAGSSDG
jgi:hypothetical protein